MSARRRRAAGTRGAKRPIAAEHERARPAPGSPAGIEASVRYWERYGAWFVAAMVAAHVVLYQAICTIKYRYYLYRDFDLAIFVQAVSGLRHGSWFSSIRGMPWLGDHTSLILVPLLPLFTLVPHTLTLLAVQTIALGLGAVPLYLLARRELPPGPLPVAAAAIYLLHPALGYLNLFEFHPETLAAPLLIWVALELRAGRWRRALIATGLALMAREDVAFVVLGYAGLAAFARRPPRRRLAAAMALMAIASLALTFAVLHPMLLGGQATYGKMYETWGHTPGEMLRHAITRPLDVLSAFWNSPGNVRDSIVKRQYWPQMFAPMLALPLLAPLWLLPALPILMEHMLSERIQQHTIVFQYTALVLPSVSVAAVLGLAGLVRRASRTGAAHEPDARPPAPPWAPTLAMLMVAAGLLSQWLWGGVFGTAHWQDVVRNEQVWPDSLERTMRPYRDRMMARIPRDGAVVAGFEFLSHLATRSELHSMHHVLSGTYTYSDRPYPLPQNVTAIVGDMTGQIPYMDFHSGERLRAMAAEHDLRPAEAVGGTIEMLPGATDSVEFYRIGERYEHPRLNLLADGQMLFLGAVRLDSLVAPGQVLRIKSYWERVAPGNRSYLSQAWLLGRGKPDVYGRARMLCYGLLLVHEWPLDSIVSETYHLLIPNDTPPGNYRPVFRLIAVDSLGTQGLPMVQVGNIVEPMNLAGLGDVTVTAAKRR